MTDYLHWARRAEEFIRNLDYLPGQWGVSVAVAPPLPIPDADALKSTLSFTASAHSGQFRLAR